LKHQNAGTLRKIRVFFNHYGILHAIQYIVDKNVVICQLIIAMSRDLHLLLFNELLNRVEYLAHDSIITCQQQSSPARRSSP
jgi:hypothetical protein